MPRFPLCIPLLGRAAAALLFLAARAAGGQEPPGPPGLPPLPARAAGAGPKDADALFPHRPAAAAAAGAVTVRWSGESVEEMGPAVVLSKGLVELAGAAGGGMELRADLVEYDRDGRSLRATGDVRVRHPEFALRCSRLDVSLALSGDSPSGEAWDVVFDVPPSWTLASAHVTFVSYPGDSLGAAGRLMGGGRAARTTELRFEEASVTPCPAGGAAAPGWTAGAARLDLTAGSYDTGMRGYATLRGAVLRIKSVPVAWAPWVLYPARADRSPGLLPPALGYSSRLGATVGLSHFQPLGQTADVTLSPTWYSEEGAMWGLEARWAPREAHGGSLSARYIRPATTGEARYRAGLHEIWDTEGGWLVRADINQASDQMFDAEFGGPGSLPLGDSAQNSSLFVGRNFRRASFSLSASEQRTFFQADDPFYRPDFPGSMQRHKLPEAQLRLYPVSLGRLYLDGSARYGRLGYSLDVGGDVPRADYFWERGDCQLRLQGRLGQLGPLRADVQAGVRYTRYGAVLTDSFFDLDSPGDDGGPPPNPIDAPDFDPFRVEGPPAQRWLGSGRLQISSPQFGRAFTGLSLAGYRGDIKHIVEPTLAFTFNSKSRLAGVFPRFDEADTRPGVGSSAVGERSVELGIRQHFFGRPGAGSAYSDIVKVGAAIRYYFDPIILSDGRVGAGWGSLSTSVDVEPSDKVRLSFRRSSEMLDSAADSSASADVAVGRRSLVSLAFFSSAIDQLQVRSRGVRVGVGQSMLGDRLRLRAEANYDAERRLFAQSLVSLAYAGACVECGLRYRHVALPLVSQLAKEDRLDFTLSLKNLGELFSAEIGEAMVDLFR